MKAAAEALEQLPALFDDLTKPPSSPRIITFNIHDASLIFKELTNVLKTIGPSFGALHDKGYETNLNFENDLPEIDYRLRDEA